MPVWQGLPQQWNMMWSPCRTTGMLFTKTFGEPSIKTIGIKQWPHVLSTPRRMTGRPILLLKFLRVKMHLRGGDDRVLATPEDAGPLRIRKSSPEGALLDGAL